jgi:hypothetical protein
MDCLKLIDIFTMNNRVVAVVDNIYNVYLIDLNTKTPLTNLRNITYISKVDEEVISLLLRDELLYLYNINKKSIINVPTNYKLEDNLGYNLYSYVDDSNKELTFRDYNRLVISSNNELILNSESGYINRYNNNLVITNTNKLKVYNIINKTSKELTTPNNILYSPYYYNGNIFLIYKNLIKILDLDFKLEKEIKVDNLDNVIDFEIRNSIIMISSNNTKININIESSKTIKYNYIESYPYWENNYLIASNNDPYNDNDTLNDYYIYDKELNLINHLKCNYLYPIDCKNENLFLSGTFKDNKLIKYFYNFKTKTMKEINYDFIIYLNNYGLAYKEDKLDIVDEELNVIISNLDYKKLHIKKNQDKNINYFIMNDYLTITIYLRERNGKEYYYTYLIDKNNNILIDSNEIRCYKMSNNYIKIVTKDKIKYLNTLTNTIEDIIITNEDINKEKIKKLL